MYTMQITGLKKKLQQSQICLSHVNHNKNIEQEKKVATSRLYCIKMSHNKSFKTILMCQSHYVLYTPLVLLENNKNYWKIESINITCVISSDNTNQCAARYE